MTDRDEFDRWAAEYDEGIDAHAEGYPFEGYYHVLARVRRAVEKTGARILEIGIGTGLLTAPLYRDAGARITGIDFSPQMLDRAREKMPRARLLLHDVSQGLPAAIDEESFDYIVSSYAFHHLPAHARVDFVLELRRRLERGGRLLIADISFPTRDDLEACRRAAGEAWDGDEDYVVADELVRELAARGTAARYVRISSCAGMLEVQSD